MTSRDIVIIGAGILGAAVAWQLGRKGLGGRVKVVDRAPPMSGSTSRAAALVTLLRDDTAQVALAQETLRAITTFEQQGEEVGRHPAGSVHVVPSSMRAVYDARLSACMAQGVRAEWMEPRDAQAKVPWLNLDKESACVWVPDDCYVDGYQLGMAYLRNAQRLGVQVRLDADVTRIDRTDGCVCALELATGERLAATQVVLAAGAWSNRLSVAAGVPLPMAPVRSQYWITGALPREVREGAIAFLPARRAYFRPELQGVLFGLREPQALAVDARTLPSDLASFAFDVSDPLGWKTLTDGFDQLATAWPGVSTAPLAHYVNGPSNYTSDGQLLVGPSTQLPGLWLATGCNGSGITFSGGIGRLLAEQMAGDASPFVDPHTMQPDRMGRFDPFAPEFIAACAATRSSKTTG